MRWQQLITDVFLRMSQEMEYVLDGLTADDLNTGPAPGANTIGWLAWHMTRSLDRTVGDCISGEQLWVKDRWHKRFNRLPDPNDTGYGHTLKETSEFRILDETVLVEYHRAVVKIYTGFISNLSENDLDREFENSAHPGTLTTLKARLVGNINDCFQHVGQAAYVRGLLKGQGWLGR